MSNADNPIIGAEFQKQVGQWFEKEYGKKFISEKKIAIGFNSDNLKEHKFDIVSEDNTIAIECKRYTWTESGNVPSAKMGFTNEAAFYLSFLDDVEEKYIVMLRSYNEKRGETLAEYYYRTNSHLLGHTKVAEYDPESGEMRILGEDKSKTMYYLILGNILGKMDNPPYGVPYIFSNGEWTVDNNNEIRDRLIGYDPFDDSCYGIGNTEIMNEIKEITREEAAEIIKSSLIMAKLEKVVSEKESD